LITQPQQLKSTQPQQLKSVHGHCISLERSMVQEARSVIRLSDIFLDVLGHTALFFNTGCPEKMESCE